MHIYNLARYLCLISIKSYILPTSWCLIKFNSVNEIKLFAYNALSTYILCIYGYITMSLKIEQKMFKKKNRTFREIILDDHVKNELRKKKNDCITRLCSLSLSLTPLCIKPNRITTH